MVGKTGSRQLSPFPAAVMVCMVNTGNCSQKVKTCNSNLLYLDKFVFDLFFRDYFVTFSVEFRLSIHLDLVLKSGDQKLLKDLC